MVWGFLRNNNNGTSQEGGRGEGGRRGRAMGQAAFIPRRQADAAEEGREGGRVRGEGGRSGGEHGKRGWGAGGGWGGENGGWEARTRSDFQNDSFLRALPCAWDILRHVIAENKYA